MEKFAKIIKTLLLLRGACSDEQAIYNFNCAYCGVIINKGEKCYRDFVCTNKTCIERYKKDKEEFKKRYKNDYNAYLLERLKE